MTRQKKAIPFVVIIAVLLVSVAIMADSCGGSSTDIQQQQQHQNLTNATKMCKSVGGCDPELTYSNELANQKQWYRIMNNPAAIGYVYLLSQTGQLVFEYQVKGKCSSTESQLTTPATINTDSTGQTGGGVAVIPAPQPDGSYGQNENAIFCFLNNGAHSMIEFNAASWYWVWSQERITFPVPAVISIVPNGG